MRYDWQDDDHMAEERQALMEAAFQELEARREVRRLKRQNDLGNVIRTPGLKCKYDANLLELAEAGGEAQDDTGEIVSRENAEMPEAIANVAKASPIFRAMQNYIQRASDLEALVL